MARSKIFYKAAEMKMSDPFTVSFVGEDGKWVTETEPGKLEEDLVPLLNEPYEEALKIVGITPNEISLWNDCKNLF